MKIKNIDFGKGSLNFFVIMIEFGEYPTFISNCTHLPLSLLRIKTSKTLLTKT